MDPKIKRLVDQVKAHLHETYGEGIKRVILYGSTNDSDVDVLVLVDRSLNPREVEDSLGDLLYGIVLDEGELVSVIAVSEGRFQNYNSPFMLNVRKEGVTA